MFSDFEILTIMIIWLIFSKEKLVRKGKVKLDDERAGNDVT